MIPRALLAGALLLLGARCASPPPRPLEPGEIAEVEQAVKGFSYPVRQAEFWRRFPFRRGLLKPSSRSLTTGTIWEYILLADDRFLVLRTRADGRPDVDDWIDGAGVSVIPGHPWKDP